jgi:hypothetical protein
MGRIEPTAHDFSRPRARAIWICSAPARFFNFNAGKTEAGEQTLADWLKNPAALAEVRARQGAV